MRWTDEFLDTLRNQSDELADYFLTQLITEGEIDVISEIFKKMNSNNSDPLHSQFPALDAFYHKTKQLPPDTDYGRIKKGEEIFARNAFPAALVMLTKSLPEGYAAPNLAIILNISKNLEQHAYRRLLQVLQMLLNVCALEGFSEGGRAVITAQKLRLLHSGIRHIAHTQVPEYNKKYGVAVNHEDMLATIMGFSLLVIKGMRTLECGMSAQQEEDYFYLWRIFALMMGIHPPNQPNSFEYIPNSVEDAENFYTAFARRHYRPANENPDGIQLTSANLKMLKEMIPTGLRQVGFGFIPRVYSYHLLGKEASDRVGVKRLPGHALIKALLFNLPRIWFSIYNLFFDEKQFRSTHHYLGERIFQGMINHKFGHTVTFTVPDTLQSVRKMVLN